MPHPPRTGKDLRSSPRDPNMAKREAPQAPAPRGEHTPAGRLRAFRRVPVSRGRVSADLRRARTSGPITSRDTSPGIEEAAAEHIQGRKHPSRRQEALRGVSGTGDTLNHPRTHIESQKNHEAGTTVRATRDHEQVQPKLTVQGQSKRTRSNPPDGTTYVGFWTHNARQLGHENRYNRSRPYPREATRRSRDDTARR